MGFLGLITAASCRARVAAVQAEATRWREGCEAVKGDLKNAQGQRNELAGALTKANKRLDEIAAERDGYRAEAESKRNALQAAEVERDAALKAAQASDRAYATSQESLKKANATNCKLKRKPVSLTLVRGARGRWRAEVRVPEGEHPVLVSSVQAGSGDPDELEEFLRLILNVPAAKSDRVDSAKRKAAK